MPDGPHRGRCGWTRCGSATTSPPARRSGGYGKTRAGKLPHSTMRTRWPFGRGCPSEGSEGETSRPLRAPSHLGFGPPSRSLARSTSVPGLDRFHAVPSGATSWSLTQRSKSGASDRGEDFRFDRADHPEVLLEGSGLEHEHVLPQGKPAIVVGTARPRRRDRRRVVTDRRKTSRRTAGTCPEESPAARRARLPRRDRAPRAACPAAGSVSPVRQAFSPMANARTRGSRSDAVVDAADVPVQKAQHRLRVVESAPRPRRRGRPRGPSPRRRASQGPRIKLRARIGLAPARRKKTEEVRHRALRDRTPRRASRRDSGRRRRPVRTCRGSRTSPTTALPAGAPAIRSSRAPRPGARERRSAEGGEVRGGRKRARPARASLPVRGPGRSRRTRVSGAMLSQIQAIQDRSRTPPRHRRSCAGDENVIAGTIAFRCGGDSTAASHCTAPGYDSPKVPISPGRPRLGGRPLDRVVPVATLVHVGDEVPLRAVAAAHVLEHHGVPAVDGARHDLVLAGALPVVRRAVDERWKTARPSRQQDVGLEAHAVAHGHGDVPSHRNGRRNDERGSEPEAGKHQMQGPHTK